MWMSLVGDLIGSSYENGSLKGKDLPFLNEDSTITDETVLLVATADSVLNKTPYSESYLKWASKYPDVQFGPGFKAWLENPGEDALSYGNGAASRASILGLAFDNEKDVLREAKESALCSHGHPEGIAGAQAAALSVFLAKTGSSYLDVQKIMAEKFDYLMFYDLDFLNREMGNDTTATNTVPVAIYLGFTSESVEECIKNCLYVGGDVDTIMSIACAISSAKFPNEKIPDASKKLYGLISKDGEMSDIIANFTKRYDCNLQAFHENAIE